MAVPMGTTGRNLESISRWTLAGVMIVGMLSWWSPGFQAWGALSVVLLVVWMLWLLLRILQAGRAVSSHPIYLALVAPALILAYHAARTGLGNADQTGEGLSGALNMSMLFHLWLLATGVLVTQSLLPQAARHEVVLGLCGAAMMGGSILAIVLGPPTEGRFALGFVGLAGVCVWLTPLWGAAAVLGQQPHPLMNRKLRIACVVVAALACVVLARFTPREAVVSLGVVAAVVILAGLVFAEGRWTLLVAGCGLAAIVVATFLIWPGRLDFRGREISWLGSGEDAFAVVSAADTGLAVLARTVGLVGVGWLVLGLAASGTYLLLRAGRGRHGDCGRAILWTTAAGLTSCALLDRGGWFIPSVTLAAAFTWGLLPVMLSRQQRRLSGAWILLGLMILMCFLGLARKSGLVSWIMMTFGVTDFATHIVVGFVLALVLAWLTGLRRVWWGLAGITAAVLAGGAGEAFQGLLSQRGMQGADWLAHAIGCAAAAPLYLLCMASRLCESPDARPSAPQADGVHTR